MDKGTTKERGRRRGGTEEGEEIGCTMEEGEKQTHEGQKLWRESRCLGRNRKGNERMKYEWKREEDI